MARVVRQSEAKRLGLPGRTSLEFVSGGNGNSTLRLVEIAVPAPGESLRGPHCHDGFEECIYVISGRGAVHADSGVHALEPGDAIVIPPGEWHVTRNTGDAALMLLCFFPVPEVAPGTQERPGG